MIFNTIIWSISRCLYCLPFWDKAFKYSSYFNCLKYWLTSSIVFFWKIININFQWWFLRFNASWLYDLLITSSNPISLCVLIFYLFFHKLNSSLNFLIFKKSSDCWNSIIPTVVLNSLYFHSYQNQYLNLIIKTLFSDNPTPDNLNKGIDTFFSFPLKPFIVIKLHLE